MPLTPEDRESMTNPEIEWYNKERNTKLENFVYDPSKGQTYRRWENEAAMITVKEANQVKSISDKVASYILALVS